MTRSLILIVALIASLSAHAAEPWADERLKERDGLALWLDASRQGKAAEALGRRAPAHEGPLDAWLDASGNKLHLAQLTADARPVFLRPDGKGAPPPAVRFDGKDDHLALAATGREPLKTLTLVLVAAPRSAPAGFSGMLATAASGKNDYTSGLNVDFGPWGSPRFDTVNVEGAGMGGFNNLFAGHPAAATGYEFGAFHSVVLTVGEGSGGVALRVDGKPAGKRDRAAGAPVRLDHLVLGARLYSNGPPAPFVQGFFDGQVAEVLLYDRVLDKDAIGRVEQYLEGKYAISKAVSSITPPPPGSRPLVAVENPPAVQMFVPGFTARKLPLDLTNVNNLRYRPDGKLVAVAYDGKVHLLTDTDGDGLEDKAETFWDNPGGSIQSPIGMALTPPGYAKGDGLFVAGKGKVSLIVDTDKDDKADREIVVATGWPVLPHGVDALGVAVDKDGSVLFGLGTTNFANGYLVGLDGKAGYDIKGERGTVMRVAPDFGKREIVATGIRFPVAIAFNPAGDLFLTDQEGATWLPNGNPFDELLHVEQGKHYGFPPRHPKHLPNVIDEPSVFDYRPQHQSTCGLAFNVPVNGGPTFGPKEWAGDALVTGYSRGKLYRTQLVKTPVGYVARNHLIASTTMLLAEACVSPKGELVLAAHGGAPDWGTGPAGKGVLYKVTYADPAKPQPLFAYGATAREVRVTFDRPLDPASLKGLAARATIDHGEAVAAGDRFEVLRPGYEVVKRQLLAPRFGLDVLGVAMTADRQTLILQTAPMSAAWDYALTLPGLGGPPASGGVAQADATDLAYDLTGVEATWTPGEGKGPPTWTGWLPHFDLSVADALTAGSPEHDALRELMKQRGVLRLRGHLDLSDMLRPAVQPGSKLDVELPPEEVVVSIEGHLTGIGGGSSDKVTLEPAKGGEGVTRVRVTGPKQWVALDFKLRVRGGGNARPRLAVTYHTNEDPRPRALPLRRVLLPWARPGRAEDRAGIVSLSPRSVPELAGGSWARGRAVYHSEQAMCAKCHVLREDGTGKIGPDLSNLHHRDYASVLKDVLEPSAAINPDHIAYAILLHDGTGLAGVPRTEDGGATIVVGEPGGQESRVRKADVKAMEPLSTSIMPHGIDQTIGREALRDLMTFLLAPPLEPAKLEIPGAPPPRTKAEVDAVLKRDTNAPAAAAPAAAAKKDKAAAPRALKIVLAAGPKDHGPGEHDYPAWQKRWAQLLSRAEHVEVDTAFGWPEQKHFDSADVIVFYSNNPGWAADKAPQLDAYLQRGGGLVYVHFAVDGHAAPDVFAERIGLAWRGGGSKFRHGALDLQFADRDHPITRGFPAGINLIDESYWQLVGNARRLHLLAGGVEEKEPRPLLWTHQPEGVKGRVFVSIPGHYAWTFDDPLFRVLLLRGVAWCAGEADVDRLSHLATLGARVEGSGSTPAPAK